MCQISHSADFIDEIIKNIDGIIKSSSDMISKEIGDSLLGKIIRRGVWSARHESAPAPTVSVEVRGGISD